MTSFFVHNVWFAVKPPDINDVYVINIFRVANTYTITRGWYGFVIPNNDTREELRQKSAAVRTFFHMDVCATF